MIVVKIKIHYLWMPVEEFIISRGVPKSMNFTFSINVGVLRVDTWGHLKRIGLCVSSDHLCINLTEIMIVCLCINHWRKRTALRKPVFCRQHTHDGWCFPISYQPSNRKINRIKEEVNNRKVWFKEIVIQLYVYNNNTLYWTFFAVHGRVWYILNGFVCHILIAL